ncbi:Protein MEI2-like 4 [Bienertia sinuspersici]
MPSQMMDQQDMSASPYFSEDLQFSGEKQVGFWKMDGVRNDHGTKTDAVAAPPCAMPAVSSSFDKLVHVDSLATKCFENPEQKTSVSLQRHAVGAERALSRSVNLWSSMDLNPVARSNANVQASWNKNTACNYP